MLQGNITFKPLTTPPAAPVVANNGLSIDGSGNLVLGNDVGSSEATLLNDREIPMDGFTLSFRGTNAETRIIDGNRIDIVNGQNSAVFGNELFPTISFFHSVAGFPAQITFGATGAANSYNIINEILSSGSFIIGEAVGSANNTRLEINDPAQTIGLFFTTSDFPGLLIDFATGTYSLGDIGSSNQGSFITIDDNSLTGIVRIGNATNNVNLTMNGDAGFTGTVAAPATITVNNGIVTNVA